MVHCGMIGTWHLSTRNKITEKETRPQGSSAVLPILERLDYMKKYMKIALMLCLVLMVSLLFATSAFAASGDVAGAIEGTWNDASEQIKTVVNKVVFPAIDLILAVFFFAKLGTAYFDYRKHGQFEWAAPAILFACLVFTLTAPTYIWTILGI